MPARLARSSVQIAAPKNARNKTRKRNLDAYAIASHQVPEKNRIRASRLGEVLDDGPRQKRRRGTEDEDDGDEDGFEDEELERGTKRQRSTAGIEDIEQGSDSEGNEWTLGGLASDDEDSDLDSDEAFGESDEEKFEGYTFRGSSKRTKAPASKRQHLKPRANLGQDIDLNEEDSDNDEGQLEDEDEGVDLATMLDEYSSDDSGKDSASADETEEDDEEEDNPGEFSSDDDDDDGDDEERIARLRDRLEDMDKVDQAPRPKPSKSGPISVEDLLADLDASTRKQYSAAIKTKKKSDAPKTLSAPLPKRQQDRLDREVASKKAKEQLDRWKDTVMHNRRAEFLSFPLQKSEGGKALGTDKFISDGNPKNQLEESIRKIMEESGLASKSDDNGISGEDALIKAEELAVNKLPVEEVMRRRAELRKARDLLFREEIKAKRISKIKSKSYRRVHRKQRQRDDQLEREAREAAGLDPLDEDEKERADRLRAVNRMSTKHRDSKWAKTLKATNRTVWDDGARDSVIEQARRQEELRRRIAGERITDGEASDDSLDDEDDHPDEVNDLDENALTLRQLGRLKQLDNEGSTTKGLQSLKFMQVAEARRKMQNDDDVERLRKELAVDDGDEVESGDEIRDQGLGRAIFGPKSTNVQDPERTTRPEMEEGDLSGDDQRLENAAIVTDSTAFNGSHNNGKLKHDSAQSYSAKTAQNSKVKDSQNSLIHTTQPAAKEESWMTGPRVSRNEQRQLPAFSTFVSDNSNKARPMHSGNSDNRRKFQQPSEHNPSAGNTDGWTLVTYADEDDQDEASDTDLLSSSLAHDKARAKKQNLMDLAFAADDVETAFEAEKDEAIASEDEKEVSNHLPGWGSWTGEGLSKGIRKSNAKQRHNPLWKNKLAGVKPSDRQDARLEKVIISEKKEAKGGGKKNGKYLARTLPHGFEQKEQYERSLRLPVGPEWTTKETFNRSTRPRVVVKPGRVIEAMQRPIV